MEKRGKLLGLGYDVVFRLMYSLYVDNFYTSPTLAKDSFCHSTHLTGTLDRNWRGVPSVQSGKNMRLAFNIA